ncbi:hypothetical protein JKP88DRAFT_250248 [Tribonema minus]|uniref:Uncharacterized protein n=1 Tax=Tribonema minus TaxID=303371 RepID=A0A835YKL3_9STRA|nr:hypothetical protein JKP88DRAFT_250248 [Tribonema minus]
MDAGRQLHATVACEEQVARMMRSFPNDASIQVWAARAISALTVDEPNDSAIQRSLGQAGACAALVSALVKHRPNATVQFATAGATDALLAAVRARLRYSTVPRQALYALGAMAVRPNEPADATLLLRRHAAQVVQAIVAAMRIDVTHQDLQAAAATAIERIMEHNNNGGAAIAQQLLDAGAGNALMEALAVSTRHGAAAFVLLALAALASHGGSAAQLLAAGAAEAIMAPVAKHCRDKPRSPYEDIRRTELLSAAMSAIAALAVSAPADSATPCAAGACEAAVTTVPEHVQILYARDIHRNLLERGLEALAALASAAESHSPVVALSLVQARACEAATAALNLVLTPCGNDATLTSAMRTICALCADASAAARLSAAGARESVISAIPRCSNCPIVQTQLERLSWL